MMLRVTLLFLYRISKTRWTVFIYSMFLLLPFKRSFSSEHTHLNPFMPSGVFYLSLWTGAFPFEGVSGLFLVLLFIIVIPVLNANSVDPDQMLQIWVYNVCENIFVGR